MPEWRSRHNHMSARLSAVEVHGLAEVTVVAVIEKAFSRAQPDTIRSLVAGAEVRRYGRAETVVRQGDDRRAVLVIAGHLGLRRSTVDGREVIPKVATTGDLASLPAIAGRPTAVEAVALSPARVALWPGTVLETLAAADGRLALDLLEHVLQTFEAIVERLDGMVHQDALRRVARVLHQHGDILFGEDPAVPRTYLPALVGTSREMTGRVLRNLEANGVVARRGRNGLELVDPVGLARAALGPPDA